MKHEIENKMLGNYTSEFCAHCWQIKTCLANPTVELSCNYTAERKYCNDAIGEKKPFYNHLNPCSNYFDKMCSLTLNCADAKRKDEDKEQTFHLFIHLITKLH